MKTIKLITMLLMLCSVIYATSPDDFPVYTTYKLGTLGGLDSRATKVNNNGSVIGESETSTTIGGTSHPFLYKDGTMYDLSVFDANSVITDNPVTDTVLYYEALGINDYEMIVGRYYNGLRERACFWSPLIVDVNNNMIPQLLPNTPERSRANDINNNFQIVGNSEGVAALWQDGEIVSLGTLGGDNSSAVAINDKGKIVGFAENSDGKYYATLFDETGEGKNIQLESMGVSSCATGINNNNQIVGYYEDINHYLLLGLQDSLYHYPLP